MEQQDLLSYDSICKLIGKLILQHQFQVEQLGKALAEAQQRYNHEHEQVAHFQQKLAHIGQYGNDDSSGQRANN